ncbi:hypothetical protein [Ornithinimicrobium pratense]|uniref:Ribosomal protein L7/L12 C-terminal domain-containing protein n=1 Tax=Ornithinimicrobium pratense TaxID=2593973 RepID=A0A5J6V1C5_9MICO|nr:hypothetical protein [Ornithinimicrobium pratense]QFG67355.1 hypothetical protein FY030_00215 [Ornithinimicrobium pratense]
MFGQDRQLQAQVETLTREVRLLEDLVAQLARRAGVGTGELAELRGQTRPGITPQIRALVAQGKHIAAIKAYREETGAGLKDAKDAIDAFAADQS